MCLVLTAGDSKRQAEALLRANPGDDSAGELLKQATSEQPEDAEAFYLLGRWALVRGKFELAVQSETRAARLSSGNVAAQMQAWTMVAVAEDQMNEIAKADAAFRRAWALNRKLRNFDPNAAYEYLKVLERDHREAEVRTRVREMLRVVPGYGPAHLSQAKLLAAVKQYSQAAIEAEFALGHSLNNPAVERDAHYLLARTYLLLKKPAQAQTHREWLRDHQ